MPVPRDINRAICAHKQLKRNTFSHMVEQALSHTCMGGKYYLLNWRMKNNLYFEFKTKDEVLSLAIFLLLPKV